VDDGDAAAETRDVNNYLLIVIGRRHETTHQIARTRSAGPTKPCKKAQKYRERVYHFNNDIYGNRPSQTDAAAARPKTEDERPMSNDEIYLEAS
jgi:hypothetical protein